MSVEKMTPSQHLGRARKIRNGNGGDLSFESLCYYNLNHAKLHNATMIMTDMFGVNLVGADLCGANLTEASLEQANLTGADLSEAVLTGANLHRANLTSVKLNGPEIMDVKRFDWVSIPCRLLPWLTAHPNFSVWLPTLKIVED